MAPKKDLSDYITTAKNIKPSAEVKFRSQDGDVTESVANRTYTAKHATQEVDDNKDVKRLAAQLNKVTENAASKETIEDNLDDLESEVADEEMLDENATVSHGRSKDAGGGDSPMTYVPNAQHEAPGTEQISETALLIKLISALIEKVDDMQNFNPVIHVPAPVIHVTLPETKRTITKAVERDENNWIKTVREHIEETPLGEPLIEVETPKPSVASKRKKGK
tara:strand:+ start:971 stop:1636 length:666 start_codon:yes stop_codon:yes gene_type:complete